MYGIPADIDLRFFNGKELIQVCIGAHDLILNFDGDVSVTVTSSVGCQDSDGIVRRYVDFKHVASVMVALLNQIIVSAQGDNTGALMLEFDGGAMIAIYDDSNEFESYTVRNGVQLIVV